MTITSIMYTIILYYQFSHINDPEEFCRKHKKQCEAFNLLGRIYIAPEGINGTLAGKGEDIHAYQTYLQSLEGFKDTEFKVDESEAIPFVKLVVKTREEIVALRSDVELDVTQEKGKHLSPKEWRAVLYSDEDIILLDARNNYESDVGHFKGAVKPDVENFYDFEQWLEENDLKKDKKVLMYCTGGIRCEKLSVLMNKRGFKDIYQLHGGIINYAQKEGDTHFKGKCFVFDDRLTVPIEKNQQEPMGQCKITKVPCDTYINCANMDCNSLFICSEEGAKKMDGCCCEECITSQRRRPFDSKNIYQPSRKWYEYYEFKTKDGFVKNVQQ